MNETELQIALENMGPALRSSRERIAAMVVRNPHLFPALLHKCFASSDKPAIRAAWILEIVCESDITFLLPHLNTFCHNISKVTEGSAVRPMSKICLFLAKAYAKNDTSVCEHLNETSVNAIVESAFDWLISRHKVAVKAFAMEALFLLGKDFKWVHRELALIISHNIANESAGYQSKGKKILQKIKGN